MSVTCSVCSAELFPFDLMVGTLDQYECPECRTVTVMKAENIGKRFLSGSPVTPNQPIHHQSTGGNMSTVKANKESAIEKLRRQAEAEASAEVEQEQTEEVQAPAPAPKKNAPAKVAPKAPAKPAPKPSAKPAPAKSAPAPKKAKISVPDEFKLRLRTKLNESEKLDAIAKGVGVDMKKYAKLSGGLKKMSTVNATLGAITRAIESGELNQNSALAKVK